MSRQWLVASGTLVDEGGSRQWNANGVQLAEAQGGGALAGVSAVAWTASGAVTGQGRLFGASTVSFDPTGGLSAIGALSGAAGLSLVPTGAIGGTGAVSGAVTLGFSLQGLLEGAGPASPLAGSVSFGWAATGRLVDGLTVIPGIGLPLLALTPDATPSQLVVYQPSTGSRFGFGVFGTATFGGLAVIPDLALVADTVPGGLILTGD